MNHTEVPEDLINTDIDYRHLGKDIEKYSGELFQDEGVIVSIQEVEDENLEEIYSVIHVQNPETSTNYDVLYIGQVDYLEDDYIKFVGLPLMDTQFENISGGTTKLFMMLAGHLEKIE